MKQLAAIEILVVFATVELYVWRWQRIYPDVAIYLLAFIVATFFVHRDGFEKLGFGSRGFLSTLGYLWLPTLAAGGSLILLGWINGSFANLRMAPSSVNSFGRYFAWCVFQQFGMQSFFTNRLADFIEDANHAAWISAAIFGCIHIPNPVLIPVTFLGGYLLSRLFLRNRNILPLAFAQAVVGILLSITLPATWHHGLRVGPGYYR